MDAGPRKPRRAAKILLSPLVLLNKGLGKLLSKAADSGGDKTAAQENIMSVVDAEKKHGSLENESAQMINNILFEFGDLAASDIMTHRKNILGVSINSSLDDIVYIALEKGFSRIPVYKDSIDSIIGIIIVKDLLCLVGNDNKDKLKIEDFLRDVVYVPESCPCSEVFKQLTNLKSGMGVVIDEYGGTAGIITLEDIIESIMGDIEDEYDEERNLIIPRSGGAFEVDGEADPEEVLELFGYALDDNHEYDTIAGFVTDLLGYIPEEQGDHPKVRYKDIIFKVMSVADNCIQTLIVRPCKEEELALEAKQTQYSSDSE